MMQWSALRYNRGLSGFLLPGSLRIAPENRFNEYEKIDDVVHDSAAVHTMQWNAYFYLRAPSKNEEFLYFPTEGSAVILAT
jgi:hypothetical protein